MKGSKGFAIGFTIFILLLFAVQLNMPGRFSWEPTVRQQGQKSFRMLCLRQYHGTIVATGILCDKKDIVSDIHRAGKNVTCS